MPPWKVLIWNPLILSRILLGIKTFLRLNRLRRLFTFTSIRNSKMTFNHNTHSFSAANKLNGKTLPKPTKNGKIIIYDIKK